VSQCSPAGFRVRRSEQRYEILVAEEAAQRLDDEHQAILGGRSFADQEALAIDILLIGANERIR
jgi:hypothetical protein